MPIVTLRDLYVAELHDLADAEQQILQELPGMAARATSAELRKAFEDHYEQTQVHIERLELLLRQLDERPRLDTCDGVRGIIREAQRIAADAERGDVLDAALIGGAQRIEHYEMAAYGCARSYAQTLGDAEASRVLQQTLDEERRADARLSELAEQGINHSAGDDLLPHSTTYRSRLRYVAPGDLDNFRYGGWTIETSDGDGIGTIDGLVVNGDNGRPLYYVVDSGGWFSGRRYLLPVSQLTPDGAGKKFTTELTRDQLRRYPEFSPSAFIAMDDDEAARYERRMLDAVLPYWHDPHRPSDRPAYDRLPLYQAPTWLIENTGWAAVPPPTVVGTAPQASTRRTSSDSQRLRDPGKVRAPRAPQTAHDDRSQAERERERPQNELMVARGEPAERSDQVERQASRIEKYRDR